MLYGSFASGDYTNRKMQLVEALALAAMSGRKLLIPWMCDREPVTYLYDAAALDADVGVVEDTGPWQNGDDRAQWPVRLNHMCGDNGVQVALPHGFAARGEDYAIKGSSWRGVNWKRVDVRRSNGDVVVVCVEKL